MSFEEGPYVQVACICESVLQEVSGVISLIRIIDTIETSSSGSNPPEKMPPITLKAKMVLMLKSGRGQGRWDLRIVPQLPTGGTKEPILFTVHLEGAEKGQNFIIDLTFTFEDEGTHWFNVYLGDEKLSSIPLRAKYSRQITTPRRPPQG